MAHFHGVGTPFNHRCGRHSTLVLQGLDHAVIEVPGRLWRAESVSQVLDGKEQVLREIGGPGDVE